MIIKLLMINFICTYIINYSGFITDLSKLIYTRLNKGKQYDYQLLPKPFSCSVCMTFWLSLLYLLYKGEPIIPILFLSTLNSLTTSVMNNVIQLFLLTVDKINNIIK